MRATTITQQARCTNRTPRSFDALTRAYTAPIHYYGPTPFPLPSPFFALHPSLHNHHNNTQPYPRARKTGCLRLTFMTNLPKAHPNSPLHFDRLISSIQTGDSGRLHRDFSIRLEIPNDGFLLSGAQQVSSGLRHNTLTYVCMLDSTTSCDCKTSSYIPRHPNSLLWFVELT